MRNTWITRTTTLTISFCVLSRHHAASEPDNCSGAGEPGRRRRTAPTVGLAPLNAVFTCSPRLCNAPGAWAHPCACGSQVVIGFFESSEQSQGAPKCLSSNNPWFCSDWMIQSHRQSLCESVKRLMSSTPTSESWCFCQTVQELRRLQQTGSIN